MRVPSSTNACYTLPVSSCFIGLLYMKQPCLSNFIHAYIYNISNRMEASVSGVCVCLMV